MSELARLGQFHPGDAASAPVAPLKTRRVLWAGTFEELRDARAKGRNLRQVGWDRRFRLVVRYLFMEKGRPSFARPSASRMIRHDRNWRNSASSAS
jgi:hypothetical protein